MRIETPSFGFELVRRFLHLPQKYPTKIQVEITNRCNLTCEICPRTTYNLPNRDMTPTAFQQILSKLPNAEVILPVGWGESFLHKEIDIIINAIQSSGHIIKMPTNGTNVAQAIDTALKVDYLTFSIDEMHNDNGSGTSQSNRIFDTIEMLIQERKRRNITKPYITVQSVLLKNNDGIFNIIRRANSIGVNRISLLRPNLFDHPITLNWSSRKRIYKKAEKLGKELNIRIDMFEYALFTGVKRWLWKNFKGLFRINSWCPRLYDFAYVTLEGKVTPCCYLPRHIVGDLNTQSMDDIWNGKAMQEFRKNHPQICQSCQILKIK